MILMIMIIMIWILLIIKCLLPWALCLKWSLRSSSMSFEFLIEKSVTSEEFIVGLTVVVAVVVVVVDDDDGVGADDDLSPVIDPCLFLGLSISSPLFLYKCNTSQ